MKKNESLELTDLNESELKSYSGGNFLLGLLAGYVFSEVMQGIYQAQKAGCFKAHRCS